MENFGEPWLPVTTMFHPCND